VTVVIVLAFVFGCLAAVANASTNVMQRAANRTESQELEFSFQLIKNLLRKPLWLASIAVMISSFLLQAAGLGLGSLAAIEPLLVLELPLTLVGSHLFLGGHLGRREWSAIGVMTAGLIGLIAFLDPSGGQHASIGWPVWLAAVAATALPIGLVFWLGVRGRSPGRRAGLLGLATGMGFGLAAALIKGMTEQYSSGGITGVLTAWQLYGAAVAGILAFWLGQNAVNAGRLAAAQPGMTLGDPCVSIVWGALVFSETMRGGPWLVGAIICAAAMTVGAIVLARSPATTGAEAAREDAAPTGKGDDGQARQGGTAQARKDATAPARNNKAGAGVASAQRRARSDR
jgi:drug/metabolite transporter (DMT)-like permease